MNLAGQFSGQLPNLSGHSLSAMPQNNGDSIPRLVPISEPLLTINPAFLQTRKIIQRQIYECIKKRLPKPDKIVADIARRVEEELFKTSTTKDEYMNLETLETRIHSLIKSWSMIKQRQLYQHNNPSLSIGTMIPTPGMSQSGNSSLLAPSSIDNSLVSGSVGYSMTSSSVNTGSLVPDATGPSVGPWPWPNGYQQSPSRYSINSGGNSMISSMGAQRRTSRMMPTPGFNSSSNNANNQSDVNMESSKNIDGLSNVESATMSQPLQQKQNVGGQNSRTLHNLGSHMFSPQQKSYGASDGALNNGLGPMGGNLQMVNGSGTPEGYPSAALYGNSSKSFPQHCGQHQSQMLQDDGYASNSADSSGSGNFYVPTSSAASMMNSQNLNQVGLQALHKTSTPMVTNQLSMQSTTQVADIKPSMDQIEKMGYQSQHSLRQNAVKSQQRSHQFQHTQRLLLQNQIQQKQRNQQNQFQHSHITNQFQQNSTKDLSRATQLLNFPFSSQDMSSSLRDASQQMQHLSHQNQFVDLQNKLTSPVGAQSEAVMQGPWHPRSQNVTQVSGNMSREHIVQEDFRQRIAEQDQAQHNNLSSEGSVVFQTVMSRAVEPPNPSGGVCRPGDPNRNLRKWLSLLLHARHCNDRAGKCLSSQCTKAQELLKHVQSCKDLQCLQPRCRQTKNLIGHFKRCKYEGCDVCVPAKMILQTSCVRPDFNSTFPRSVNGPCEYPGDAAGRFNVIPSPSVNEASEDLQPSSIKRRKLEASVQSMATESESSVISTPAAGRFNVIPSPSVNEASQDLQPSSIKRRKLEASVQSMSTESESSVISTPAAGRFNVIPSPSVNEASQDLQPSSIKRRKLEASVQSIATESESSVISIPAVSESDFLQDIQQEKHLCEGPCMPMNQEVTDVKVGIPVSVQGCPNIEAKKDYMEDSYSYTQKPDEGSILTNDPTSVAEQDFIKIEKVVAQTKLENVTVPAERTAETKSGKPKIKGVSMMELYSLEQIREHIKSLKQWVGQSKAKAEKNQAMEHSMSENSCRLCAVEKLAFEPPPIYCSPCGARIKRNAIFYTTTKGDTQSYFCIPCHNEARGDTIIVDGTPVPKARLEKKKNDEETEESWVQCDKCEAWQHQICALFNGRRNDGGQAEYTCPSCYIEEVERGERQPLPETAVLGAKDLPRTNLSDHIEQRLFKRLKQERQERATALRKSYDEVPGAESLVVRVVSSVDKKLEVKQRFLEIFQENYPTEFGYKSKVILLFQKIESVEVCLFGMYVQEFGSECAQPNSRRVYLSYLDSVKYFRPEIRTVTGEALRTFVYHEILIGYLEYCKKRGFTSCYIWACPPFKGEDYILYCHPEIQKTPKSDKLREWYLAMLRKASEENVVVDLTNLYDHFFLSYGECKAKVTAARLPYFDGDYWPGAAEDIIYQLRQEEDGRKNSKKGSTKKTITKRALRASGQADLYGNESKDLQLMHKLGETISPMKEDFIMVHLQHACTHCCNFMVVGKRWVCDQCKKFQLCDNCYEMEQKVEERERHPINQRDKHILYPVEINCVPTNTKDSDEILESEFFDTRQAFLSLCQGNHYQYDTLRRAKHSSMMVLYHLHNPTAPAFVTTCNECHLEIEPGQGWRCEVCPDYDLCNACYQKGGEMEHPHKLTNHPLIAERNAQSKEARQQRVLQLRKMLDLLVHAAQCRSQLCEYPNCRQVKSLFRHGIKCKVRFTGGCSLCKKIWELLHHHARTCKESQCTMPRCKDLKEHMRRLQQQSDSRRRAAVTEMMRQRAAEVAGSR